MNSPDPLVTIGIPVYNGERYLARAIESLLAQTMSDLELIIADNASTDGTQALCQEFARRDTRVRYVRHPVNIGAPRNWNCLVHLARGKYFKWASANDYCAPAMLARCIESMQADPGIVLCYGHTQLVGDDEQPLEVFAGDIDVQMAQPSDRFSVVCNSLTLNNAMCGVVLTSVLRRTGLDRLYPSGDMALMCELALYGRFRLLPDVLLYRRQSKDTFTSMLSPAQIQRVYNPAASSPIRVIHGRRHWDHFCSIARAPIRLMEKLRAFRTAFRLMVWDRRHLWREVRSLMGAQPAP